MIRGFVNDRHRLRAAEHPEDRLDELIWLDLISPTPEEEALLERAYGIDIPTRPEMDEIEISSRLYREDGVMFMTATVVAQSDSQEPVLAPVSFVLDRRRVITVRYHEPRAFETFPARAARADVFGDSAEGLLVALLEAVVDRIADILEGAVGGIDAVSRGVFRPETVQGAEDRNFQRILVDIGRSGDLISNISDSLRSLERLVGFLDLGIREGNPNRELRSRVKTLGRDVRSLVQYAEFLSQKIGFLLDASLGMITIEQNTIVKIFSVAAVMLLPPTLIASIYGMNFEHMPELHWSFGYPLALGLMVLSAVLSYWYFKRRGWL